ncbi:hypothetical protein OHB35_32040 [Streptomyces phaeochromogenes]|uniref:Secreted protein n=1 Tax=Streptomyces phaeochromogenes TaxID=1923 RepID=A0ABZ1HFV3_STRPH|nr:hypothetical protein [Streptomyces phaeochromogenes]WSD17491.1 hypothetical protein OHB35_32040 [Streptomyces phaeochromogenes]
MPRPTAAQLAYGSCTVIFSTLAMLLLSQTSSGLGVVVIALSALVLGLLVAMTVPVPKPAAPQVSVARPASVTLSEHRVAVRRETVAASSTPEPVRERA